MAELSVDRDSLRTFDAVALQQAIAQLESLRLELQNAHVPPDAYSLTNAGQTSIAGHDSYLGELDTRLTTLHALLASMSARVHLTAGTYQGSEDAAARGVTSIQI